MKKSLSKKSEKVIEKGIGKLKQGNSLAELTRIGARMMLEVAVEEEATSLLGTDHYFPITSEKQYSVHLRVRQCQNIFPRLDLRLQRSCRQGVKSYPEQQETFKKDSKNG